MSDYEENEFFDAMDDETWLEDDFDEEGDNFFPALAALAPVAIKAAPFLLQALSSLFEDEESYEDLEGFYDDEEEFESDALANTAAKSKSLKKILPLVGAMTAKVNEKKPRNIKKLTPLLVKANCNLARSLSKTKASKPLIKLLPQIQKKTIKILKRIHPNGRRISKNKALQVLKKVLTKTLTQPIALKAAIKKHKKNVRKYNTKAISAAERVA